MFKVVQGVQVSVQGISDVDQSIPTSVQDVSSNVQGRSIFQLVFKVVRGVPMSVQGILDVDQSIPASVQCILMAVQGVSSSVQGRSMCSDEFFRGGLWSPFIAGPNNELKGGF